MKNTTIFLIRHGELDNPTDTIYDGTISLSDLGKRNMRLLGETLKDRGVTPDVVLTSPFLRAVQSLEEILSNYSNVIPLFEDARLQDTDSPDTVGKPLSWLSEIGSPYTYPGIRIESPSTITDRMFASIGDARVMYEGKTVFMISHGDPTAFVMWKLLHPDGELPPLQQLLQDDKGITQYLQKGEAWRIILSEQMRVLEHEHIIKDTPLIRKERE